MAFTERYVTSAAGGGGAGTEGDPWTFAEGLANGQKGDRVNVKSDAGYSLGADAIDNATAPDVINALVYRGYNSSIGDLEGQGRNADGTLNVTNFPVITLTGQLTTAPFAVLEALSFVGSLSSRLVGGVIDHSHMIQCKFVNTANNASAIAWGCDDSSSLINCDCECSGASHGPVADADSAFFASGCRIKGLGGVHLALNHGTVLDTVIFGNTTGVGIQIRSSTLRTILQNCTIYDVGIAISTPASANLVPLCMINCHITDCAEYLNNSFSGTQNEWAIEVNNRTRDNTTGRTGIGDGIAVSEITTDTGGAETDFVNAGAENFRLIAAAPGNAAGMVAFDDCGA
ncbi:hypothetical protein LCGC14_2007060, partial [marine sediment metagenome]